MGQKKARPTQEAIESFMNITLASEAAAVQKLEEHGGNVVDAGFAFYNERDRNMQSRMEVGSSSVQDDAEEVEEQPLVRHRSRRMSSGSIDAVKEIGDIEVCLPSSPRQHDNDNHPQHNESDFHSDELREETFDDFDEPRPKAKRNLPTEGLDAARKAVPSLTEVIKGNGILIPKVVKKWVERYGKDPKPVMVELWMMLFEACGAKFYGELSDEIPVDEVVRGLVCVASKGKFEDYQGSKKEFKNLKDNLVSFWDNLVRECLNSSLFDQVLFNKCMDYIIALSRSFPTVCRKVASLMGLQLVTSFINVAKILGAEQETTQRQLNARKRKRSAGPQSESLEMTLSMTRKRITVIEDMMHKIYTGLFVDRYRDRDPEIQMSCIQSVGVWILSYRSLFLKEKYILHLGEALNDKSAVVRKASVLALQNLYEVDDNVPSLACLKKDYSKRMLELSDDINISVAVCAIGLFKQLLRHQIVTEEELKPFYESLLYVESADIRRATGALYYDHKIARKFNSSQSCSTGGDSDSPKVHLDRMLEVLRDITTDQDRIAYVIDDVWEYMDAMKDWDLIISLLLCQNPPSEFTDVDTTNLIRLFSASVKKAVGERIVPATDNLKQQNNKTQREKVEKNRLDMTHSVMKDYVVLLRKYVDDSVKMSLLVEIIVHMDLQLFSNHLIAQGQNFKTILELMKEAFFKHDEKDALVSCMKAINFCSTVSQRDLRDFAQNILKELEDELIDKLQSAMEEFVDGDDKCSLLVNLKRLSEIQLSRPMAAESSYEVIVGILQHFRNIDDDEVIGFLLLNMHLHVSWCLVSIHKNETVPEASLNSLLYKRETLFEQLEYFLHTSTEVQVEGSCRNQLACRVCTILVELWCLFRKANFDPRKREILAYCPDESILLKFWKHCEQQLCITDDDVNQERVEERDAVMNAAATLVATNTVPKEFLGPEIISHYVMHGTRISDIIKHLIADLKKEDEDVFNIFLQALIRAYKRNLVKLSNGNDESLSGKSFQECEDLAAKLSGTFVGAARNKHRSGILKIVKDGIDFAFQDGPKQLTFLLYAVLPFVSKLPTPDILSIIRDVEKRGENVCCEDDMAGQYWWDFLSALHAKVEKNEGFQGGTGEW